MFSNKKIVQHYARVFFEYSNTNNDDSNDFFYYKVKKIFSLLCKNSDLNKIIYTSLLSSKKKIEIFEKIIYNFDVSLFQFIKLLIVRKRESLLKEIFLEYQEIYEKEKKGIVKALIISAFPLSIDTKKMMIKKMKKIHYKYQKKKFHIINKIDRSIIGGFLFRIGNEELDFSVKGKLSFLKKEFKIK
ncbi:ATP synthase F1 subunit delta [Blattabacterium cuenoti]|uniref:ATP synthase F1 subunit delta n=1 Tax=Blattabacterium cuenoti TaxID=1653831 RepID=UPI00163CCAA5|nr:ATP synthase F1 subunit delta [Blattabacterium cuenoti]